MSAASALARRGREGAVRWGRVLAHRGDAVQCPVCDHSFDVFAPASNRANAVCWRCGAHERHRSLWLYLERRPLLEEAGSLLHFAPEWCLEHKLEQRAGLRYVTADLDPGVGELQLDITAIDLPDGAFDAVLCSHVLEHVDDDRAAIRELHRVVRAGGWVIVMVPLDAERAVTYEDPAIVDPSERERAFLQVDHVRLYGLDLVDRLRDAGFAVSRERVAQELGPELVRRHVLLPEDDVYLCRKPASGR